MNYESLISNIKDNYKQNLNGLIQILPKKVITHDNWLTEYKKQIKAAKIDDIQQVNNSKFKLNKIKIQNFEKLLRIKNNKKSNIILEVKNTESEQADEGNLYITKNILYNNKHISPVNQRLNLIKISTIEKNNKIKPKYLPKDFRDEQLVEKVIFKRMGVYRSLLDNKGCYHINQSSENNLDDEIIKQRILKPKPIDKLDSDRVNWFSSYINSVEQNFLVK